MTTPKFRDHLAKELKLSLHWVGILLLTCFLEYRLGMILLGLGLHSMVVRNLIAMPSGYLIFLGLMRMWLFALQKLQPELLSLSHDERELSEIEQERKYAGRDASWADGLSWFRFDEIFVLVVFALLAVVVFVWILGAGPVVLTDAAFDFALTGGLLKGARKIREGDWMGAVLQKTALMFLVIFIMSTLVFAVAEHNCPQAHRLSELRSACRASQ